METNAANRDSIKIRTIRRILVIRDDQEFFDGYWNREITMLNIKPRYLVNENGRRTAAVLSMKDYRMLIQRLEDLEDALDLDEAAETATSFREYAEIREELQKDGKL